MKGDLRQLLFWYATLKRLQRAVVALLLAFALLIGPLSLAASVTAGDTMPCQMEMASADAQPQSGEPIQPDPQKQKSACPMMSGGVCATLVAVAPASSSLPSPSFVSTDENVTKEALVPHIVSPLRRPPRHL